MSRLVKYTGYGNAAGLLNRRGLMLGGAARRRAASADDLRHGGVRDARAQDQSDRGLRRREAEGLAVRGNDRSQLPTLSHAMVDYLDPKIQPVRVGESSAMQVIVIDGQLPLEHMKVCMDGRELRGYHDLDNGMMI